VTYGDALVVAVIFLMLTMTVIWGKHDADRQKADIKSHNDLLEELRRQPHEEQTEYD